MGLLSSKPRTYLDSDFGFDASCTIFLAEFLVFALLLLPIEFSLQVHQLRNQETQSAGALRLTELT